jgi:3-isopropylmalate/(R)-2-methylmalate dehydratase small subunit
MKPVSVVQGQAAPLLIDNVDTDLIIPMDALLSLQRDQLGNACFAALRNDAPSTFVLDQARYRGASVLVAGRNFGCGSSREAAVDALAGLGIECIVASSFGDIFLSNCAKNSMVAAQVETSELAEIHRLLAAGGRVDATVDVAKQTLEFSTLSHSTPEVMQKHLSFVLDDGHRSQLLSGADEIMGTLKLAPRIDEFRTRHYELRPWAAPTWTADAVPGKEDGGSTH